VTFSKMELIRGGLSHNAITKLGARQRGGQSGAAGYEYQRRYAILRLVELATTDANAIVECEALCPVDDVTVVGKATSEFAQCKISPSETWQKGGKKLAKEFRAQKRLLQKLGHAPGSYRLRLVVADAAQRGKLQNALPHGLSTCVDVVHIAHPSPEHHPWAAPDLSVALDALLPAVLRTPAGRERVYKEINHAAGTPWQATSPAQVLGVAAKENDRLPIALPVPLPCTVAPALVAQARAIFAAIPGVSVTDHLGVWCYEAPSESGFLARQDSRDFARFVNDAIARQPKTLKALLEIRP
jgi:coenzyme F420-reducing hydrogenase delta subunit